MSLRFLNGVALAVLLLVAGFTAVAVVPEGERGLLYRSGELVRIGLPPGRYLRWPLVDRLERVDMRLRLTDIGRGEYHDRDGVPLLADAWVVWRVDDLPRYLRGTGADPERAAVMLLPAVQDGLRRAFAAERWAVHRRGMPEARLAAVAREASRQVGGALGIGIAEVRVRRLVPLPGEQARLLQRQREVRLQEMARSRAQADQQAQALRAAAAQERDALLRAAREAALTQRQEARTAALAEALAARRQAPGFHRYWQALEDWRRGFGKPGDVLVLGSDSELRAYRRDSGENTRAHGSGVRPR